MVLTVNARSKKYIYFKFRDKESEDLKRSSLKVLVTAKYGEPMVAEYKELEWYNVFNIEPDDVIKYLHCQYVTFDGQNLSLVMVEADSFPLWGALFEYDGK